MSTSTSFGGVESKYWWDLIIHLLKIFHNGSVTLMFSIWIMTDWSMPGTQCWSRLYSSWCFQKGILSLEVHAPCPYFKYIWFPSGNFKNRIKFQDSIFTGKSEFSCQRTEELFTKYVDQKCKCCWIVLKYLWHFLLTHIKNIHSRFHFFPS